MDENQDNSLRLKYYPKSTASKFLLLLISFFNPKYKKGFVEYSQDEKFTLKDYLIGSIGIIITAPIWIPLAIIGGIRPNQLPHRLQPIANMQGQEFEKYLASLFSKMGYSIKHQSLGTDQGGDLVVSKDGQDIVIQAKRHSYKITNRAVQEVVAAIGFYKCQNGMVVTNSSFTNAARELAESNGIDLIDGEELNRLMEKYGLW